MKSLDFVAVDADDHFYEPHDCCTRHLAVEFRNGRACHVAKNADGIDEWGFGDRPIDFHRATRDQVLPPGADRPFGVAIDAELPDDREALLASLGKVGRVTITSQGGAKTGRTRRPPHEVFREHVFVAPFFEDDVHRLVDAMGPERVRFGSDWPHPEGLAAPLDFLAQVERLPPAALRRVMRDNTAGILGIRGGDLRRRGKRWGRAGRGRCSQASSAWGSDS